jgi:putative hemolysin
MLPAGAPTSSAAAGQWVNFVMPANSGILEGIWMPAVAGMTARYPPPGRRGMHISPHMGQYLGELLLVVVLIVANGVFALAEIATVSARRARLQQRAEEGDDGARIALELISEPARFLSTVQIGITLVGILLGTTAGAELARSLADRFNSMPLLAPYAEALGTGIVVVGLTYLSLVIGELLPKQIALNNPERLASTMARPMRLLAVLTAPVVKLLSASTNLLIRLLGIKATRELPVSAEEIKIMLEQGERAGVFEPTEQDIVENALHLDELRVSAIVTPRTKIVWLDLDDPIDKLNQTVFASPHSHFPVARGTLEEVTGVLRGRDLFAAQLRGEDVDIGQMLRPPLFVPGSQSALKLLEQLRHSGQHTAMVLDEFGGLLGMATLTDVMESLVGEIRAVGVPHEPFAVKHPDGSWQLDGRITLHDLKDLLDIDELPGEEDGGFETLGGLAMAVLDKIPEKGDAFEAARWRFVVDSMEGRRVSSVRATAQA